MTIDQLFRLRRFSLAIALILLTVVFAGVGIDPEATKITPLGIPLRVESWNLLPIGLTITSVLCALRFWYYGVARTDTPWRVRERALSEWGYAKDPDRRLTNFFRPHYLFDEKRLRHDYPDLPLDSRAEDSAKSNLSRAIHRSYAAKRVRQQRVEHAFPAFSSWLERIDIDAVHTDDEPLNYLRIPTHVLAAIRFEDADYSSPIWLNIIASTCAIVWMIRESIGG